MVRWRRGGTSPHLEDRRGRRGGPGGSPGLPGGFGGAGFPGGGPGRRGPGIPIGGKLSLPFILLILAVVLFGGNLFGGGGGYDVDQDLDAFPQAQPAQLEQAPDPQEELVAFSSFVIDDVQGTWDQVFAEAGRTYEPTTLVLFEDATSTGCGLGSSVTGPFYCPLDGNVYLDLEFFQELQDRFGAPGDFAQAYVIAHEVGHHVQNLLGISDQVRRLQQQNPDLANSLSVRLELQADCFAGVWGHTTRDRGLLEPGDLEEGLTAAAAIGDDRIQEQTRGRADPETWTHGSSEQRVTWFKRGFDTGHPDSCDTFSGDI